MELEKIYIYVVIAFIIISLILIMTLLFKRKIKRSNTPVINKKDIVKYLLKNYPKIDFDVSKLDGKDSDDLEEERIIVVEDLVTQFASIEMSFPNSAPPMEHEYLWDTYLINSKPQNKKLPPDIKRRKEALLFRDKHTCQRCSKNLVFEDMRIYYLKPISEGGDYSFENMLSVCSDCHKILHSDDIKKTVQELELTDKLYTII